MKKYSLLLILALLSFFTNNAHAVSYGLNLGANEYPVIPYDTSASFPTVAPDGSVAVDKSADALYVYDLGTLSWVAAGGGGGGGSVTSVSVVSANGLAGSVANATTTPAITLSTSVTGLVKGNGTALSAAVAGTDYLAPFAGTTLQYVRGDGTLATLNSAIVPELTNLYFTDARAKAAAVADAINDGTTDVAPSQNAVFDALALKEPTITVLPLSKGGTEKALTAVAGGFVYTDADSQEVSAAGTAGQLIKSNGTSAPTWGDIPTSNTIWVDKSGNDSTCAAGAENRPCLTVAQAVTLITSPTSSNRFRIKVGVGTFTEATLTLTPWTWITGSDGMPQGGPSRISVTSNAITLDSSWSAGSQRGGLANIYLTGSTGVNFDRQAISGAGSSVLEILNVGMNGTLTFKANTGTLDFLDIRNARIFGSVLVSGGAINIVNSELYGNVTYDNSGTQNVDSDVIGNYFAGNFTATSSGANTIDIRSTMNRIDGTISFTGPATTVTTQNGHYIPGNPGDWAVVPENVEDALDALASLAAGAGDVVGPGSAVNNNVVFFDGTTGKLIKDSGLTLSGSNTGDQTITLTGDVTGSGTGSFAATIAAGVIVDADINASAAIADTKLATISTAGKVSNSATTAASANTASAIVARDGSGNFSAGTISAALSGNASTATALAANPADCGAGTKATGIAANGDLTCSAVSLTADVSGSLPVANGGFGTEIQELTTGTIDNSNDTFTISQTPVSDASVKLYQDGLLLIQGTQYTISGSTITMTTAPNFGQTLYANYRY